MPLITGGGFQDVEGGSLSFGTLKLKLSSDAYTDTGAHLVCAGSEVEVPLDVDGNVLGTVNIFGNEVLTGVWSSLLDTYYFATAETADGQLAWGPNAVTLTGSTFDVSNWIPSTPA